MWIWSSSLDYRRSGWVGESICVIHFWQGSAHFGCFLRCRKSFGVDNVRKHGLFCTLYSSGLRGYMMLCVDEFMSTEVSGYLCHQRCSPKHSFIADKPNHLHHIVEHGFMVVKNFSLTRCFHSTNKIYRLPKLHGFYCMLFVNIQTGIWITTSDSLLCGVSETRFQQDVTYWLCIMLLAFLKKRNWFEQKYHSTNLWLLAYRIRDMLIN